jgi:hypothetical protein
MIGVDISQPISNQWHPLTRVAVRHNSRVGTAAGFIEASHQHHQIIATKVKAVSIDGVNPSGTNHSHKTASLVFFRLWSPQGPVGEWCGPTASADSMVHRRVWVCQRGRSV